MKRIDAKKARAWIAKVVVAMLVAGMLLPLLVLVGKTTDTQQVSSPPVDTAPTEVVETENTSVAVTEEPVELTEPIVDNFVEDVDNSVEPSTFAEPDYTEEELEILAIIIYQEAGGDNYSDDTRLKVGSVFLNRVNSPYFPNTFEAVATGRQQYGTLYWTGIKWPDRASGSAESHAVERAYQIAEELLTGGSILPDNVVWQAEFLQGDGLYSHQDGIYFCYTEVKE